jgi:hypothetical protein
MAMAHTGIATKPIGDHRRRRPSLLDIAGAFAATAARVIVGTGGIRQPGRSGFPQHEWDQVISGHRDRFEGYM